MIRERLADEHRARSSLTLVDLLCKAGQSGEIADGPKGDLFSLPSNELTARRLAGRNKSHAAVVQKNSTLCRMPDDCDLLH